MHPHDRKNLVRNQTNLQSDHPKGSNVSEEKSKNIPKNKQTKYKPKNHHMNTNRAKKELPTYRFPLNRKIRDDRSLKPIRKR